MLHVPHRLDLCRQAFARCGQICEDEVAFAELERALSSGISLKDEGALLLLAKFD